MHQTSSFPCGHIGYRQSDFPSAHGRRHSSKGLPPGRGRGIKSLESTQSLLPGLRETAEGRARGRGVNLEDAREKRKRKETRSEWETKGSGRLQLKDRRSEPDQRLTSSSGTATALTSDAATLLQGRAPSDNTGGREREEREERRRGGEGWD
ncbi:hypothetical protein EYF80_041705 [Liparis tanakae]|uniref:Uncharacterized protein n=1 Tax=Liparis tanakae TaxID=230148 RepID=A0A4Z2G4L2_9TELE|nr:hypothetical protein EYF80_041705 [Liparis tanakae]